MIVHSFRYLYLAKQLKDNPNAQFLDFTCANTIYEEIMNEIDLSWEYYENKYKY